MLPSKRRTYRWGMKRFDRIAEKAAAFVSHAPFFAFCFVLVASWLIGLPFAGWTNDTYHLMLNSPTTAITFLMVAILENSSRRAEAASSAKQNAMAEAIADLLEDVGGDGHEDSIRKLRKAAGIEKTMSA